MRRNSRRYFCNFYASLKLLPKFLKIAPRRAEQFCKQMVGARFLTAGPGIKSQTREDGARAQPRRRRAGAEGGAGNLGNLVAPARGRRRPHGDTAAAARRADAARQAPRTSLLRRLERPRRNGGRSPRARAVSPRRPRPSRARNRALRGKADCAMGQGARTPQGQGERGAARRAERREARCTPRLLPEAPSRRAGPGWRGVPSRRAAPCPVASR